MGVAPVAGAASVSIPLRMRKGSCCTTFSQPPHMCKWQAAITFSQLYLCNRKHNSPYQFFFLFYYVFSSPMGDQEQPGTSGLPSANQQDTYRQSASTANQQTDPSMTLETLKAIMKRVTLKRAKGGRRCLPQQ